MLHIDRWLINRKNNRSTPDMDVPEHIDIDDEFSPTQAAIMERIYNNYADEKEKISGMQY
jgi:hypothetical protein